MKHTDKPDLFMPVFQIMFAKFIHDPEDGQKFWQGGEQNIWRAFVCQQMCERESVT